MSIKNGNTINDLSIGEGMTIKGDGGDGNKIDNISIIDAKRLSKVKSKDLIKLGAGFLIIEARLAFIKFKQAFIKAFTLHDFNPKYYI